MVNHRPGDFAHELLHVPGDEPAAGELFHERADEHGEHGAGTHGGEDVQEERPRPDEEPVAQDVGAAEKHAVHAAEGALVERGQEGADAREQGHDQVEIVGDGVSELVLRQLPVFQCQRHVLDDEHGAVAGDAEDDFGQHGVDVRMPVAEPCAERLADIENEHQHGAGVAQETHHDRQVDDVLQCVDVQQVAQRAGEERARAEGDDGEVEGDPEAEPEVVVKAGLAEAVGQDAEGGISAPQADRGHGNKMQQEFQQRTTRAPFREEGGVDGLVVVFHFH